jgi:FkbM family methyltransferase
VEAEAMILRGVPLELHPPGEYVSDVIRETGDFYEAAILDELAKRLNAMPPGVLIDVGAMIGNHTAFLANFAPYLEIHAFEPVPDNIKLLRANTSGRTNIDITDHALSDRRAILDIGFRYENLGHCVIRETDQWPLNYEQCFQVEAFPLDDFKLCDVRLLKIDAEWHEARILAGARKTIERCKPLICVEDWGRRYNDLFPGYRIAAEWEQHQTLLYEPV